MNSPVSTLERPRASEVATRIGSHDDTVGKRLKARRIELGYLQADVAQRIGLSRVAYAQYESDSSKLRVDQATDLAEFLSTTPEWIAFGAERLRCALAQMEINSRGRLGSVAFWTVNEAWIKARYGVRASELRLLEVDEDFGVLKTGDLAVIQKDVEPEPGVVAEFAFIQDGEIKIANLTVLGRGSTIRIRHTRTSQDDVDASSIEVVGKVLGRFGRM